MLTQTYVRIIILVGHFREIILRGGAKMDDTKEVKELTYMTNEEYQCEANNYVELIIDIARNTSDTWTLEQIYRYAKNMTKEG